MKQIASFWTSSALALTALENMRHSLGILGTYDGNAQDEIRDKEIKAKTKVCSPNLWESYKLYRALKMQI